MTRRRVDGRQLRRGFSLVESTMCILIVSVMLVTALNTVGAGATAERKMAERLEALLLAEDLMSEILQHPYEDPEEPGSIGREGEELTAADRKPFDDVDDYHNWSSTPTHADGTPMTGASEYTRHCWVKWVSANDPDADAGSPSGVKRITVGVKKGDRVVITLDALRTGELPESNRLLDVLSILTK